jgi:hypothetical protein
MPQWPVLGSAVTTRGPNRISLPSGGTYTLGPGAGVYAVRTDGFTSVQQFDPITATWVKIGGGSLGPGIDIIYSDGVNYRIANQVGCAVGALLTNAGSGYTSVPTVTASAGASIWRAIVGGAVSTTVTINAAGTNYTYPPIVLISAPPAGGIQATGHSTLSGSTVASVVIDNQGAGYANPPTITLLNDPREVVNPNLSDGYGAIATATLTGSQTVTGLLCVDHGLGGQTAVPTLSFTGGGGSSAAATAIMCFTITAYAVTTAGSGFTTAPQITAVDAFPSTASAYTNPSSQSALVSTAAANILGAVSAGGITATGQRVFFGGVYTSIPTIIVNNSGILITATAALTATVGGATSTCYVQQL